MDKLRDQTPIELFHDLYFPFTGAAMARLTCTEDTQNIDLIFEWLRQTEMLSPVKPAAQTATAIEYQMRLHNDYLLEILLTLREYPSCMHDFIKELLRFYPSGHTILRQTTEDVIFDKVTIPKGEVVLANFASANRDEAVFDDLDTFNMYRENANAHLGFGFGIGSGLASFVFEPWVKPFKP